VSAADASGQLEIIGDRRAGAQDVGSTDAVKIPTTKKAVLKRIEARQAQLQKELDDLDTVTRFIKLGGWLDRSA